jgi:hypothetical protein
VDTTRFDKFEEQEPFYPPEEKRNRKVRKDINFVGYTYKKDVEEQKHRLVEALKETLTDVYSSMQDTNVVTEEGPPRKAPQTSTQTQQHVKPSSAYQSKSPNP